MDDVPDEAVKHFRDQISQKKTSLEAASHYGLALALARQNKYAEADKEAVLAIKGGDSPMLYNLRAELKAKAGDAAQALNLYRSAIARYPQYKPLIYGYSLALILNGEAQQALTFTSAQVNLWPDDSRLWKLLARAHAALGHKLASHRAEAEAMAAQGNLTAALEQINLGLKAGDGDFYELSAAEARRREWQETLSSETSKK